MKMMKEMMHALSSIRHHWVLIVGRAWCGDVERAKKSFGNSKFKCFPVARGALSDTLQKTDYGNIDQGNITKDEKSKGSNEQGADQH